LTEHITNLNLTEHITNLNLTEHITNLNLTEHITHLSLVRVDCSLVEGIAYPSKTVVVVQPGRVNVQLIVAA
jgi:hypothetical protein